MYEAKIIADSVNECGNRLTTFELTYPRLVHAELMTHRLFSRNAASSRAIPTPKLMARIKNDPVMFKWWGKNQSGMQAREQLEGEDLEEVQRLWLLARDMMLMVAEKMRALNFHKQSANRILEPWMFITTIVTATEFDNWFHLRDTWRGDDPGMAQPEIAWLAGEMRRLYAAHEPRRLAVGEWHTPYVTTDNPADPLYVSPEEAVGDPLYYVKIATARCARVSYLTHDGVRDLLKDMGLHDKLSTSGHWSPFEHAAEADGEPNRHGNFIGWRQYRKHFKNEHFGKRLP